MREIHVSVVHVVVVILTASCAACVMGELSSDERAVEIGRKPAAGPVDFGPEDGLGRLHGAFDEHGEPERALPLDVTIEEYEAYAERAESGAIPIAMVWPESLSACLGACEGGSDAIEAFCRTIAEPRIKAACWGVVFAGEVACKGFCYLYF